MSATGPEVIVDGSDVGTIGDFIHNQPVVKIVAGRQIVVLRYGDEIYAFRNVCPHQATSFAGAMAKGCKVSDVPGSFRIDESDPVVVCPWHAWPYRLRDGVCIADPRRRIRVYDVSIVDGRVIVNV